MATKLVIDPITRIEGHGKVVIELDDDRNVTDAKLHVVEFRGYEKFIQGHPYWDCLLYTSPSPRDGLLSRMPSSA